MEKERTLRHFFKWRGHTLFKENMQKTFPEPKSYRLTERCSKECCVRKTHKK
jgi:hypothetical protein